MKYRELLFNIDPLMKYLYQLKEDYIEFNRLKNIESVRIEFDQLMNRFLTYLNKDVTKVGRSILKWKYEILNSFTRFNGKRTSNGPIESRNNIIKLLIRNAAGYRNFDHLRRRIIYCIHSKKKK